MRPRSRGPSVPDIGTCQRTLACRQACAARGLLAQWHGTSCNPHVSSASVHAWVHRQKRAPLQSYRTPSLAALKHCSRHSKRPRRHGRGWHAATDKCTPRSCAGAGARAPASALWSCARASPRSQSRRSPPRSSPAWTLECRRPCPARTVQCTRAPHTVQGLVRKQRAARARSGAGGHARRRKRAGTGTQVGRLVGHTPWLAPNYLCAQARQPLG